MVELEALKERLGRLAGAERRPHEAVTVLNTSTIDDEACRILEKLEVTAWIIRGVWGTRATRVAIEMADTILLDGEALGSGIHGPILVKAPVVVEIPGHAKTTVFPGSGTDDVERRARDAENALIEALASHGVPDVAAARMMAREGDRAGREQDAASKTIRMTLGDENGAELQARIEALAEPMGDVDAGELVGTEEERSEATMAAEAAGDRAAGARVALESARTTQQETREDLVRGETELRSLGARRDGAVSGLEAAQAGVPDEKMGAATTKAVAALGRYVTEGNAADEKLELIDTAGLEARLGNTRAMVTRLAKECGDLDEELTRLSALLDDRLAGDTCNRLSKICARLEQAEAHQASRQCAADAMNLLRKMLNRHRTEAQLRCVTPFRECIESLGRPVFGPDLVVEVTSELNIVSRTLAGETVPFQSSSSGAREQLSLPGRLTCTQLAQSGEGVLLVIDDALRFTDPEHLARLGVMLSRIGDGIQTIIFTRQPGRLDQIGDAYVIRL